MQEQLRDQPTLKFGSLMNQVAGRTQKHASRTSMLQCTKIAVLREFFLLPRLFYEDHNINEAIALSARYPDLLQFSDEVVHTVTGLSFDNLDVLKGARINCKLIAKKFCKSKSSFSPLGISLEELKNDKMHWMEKMMVVKLFFLQRFEATHLPSPQEMPGVSRMVAWCMFNKAEAVGEFGDETTSWPEDGTAIEASEQPMATKFLTWIKLIPDGHIHLDYKDRWKMFEYGLPKEECKLEDHELWRLTFFANIINILVRDLVQKAKEPEPPLPHILQATQDKASMAEAKMDFIFDFIDIWVNGIKETDLEYKMFCEKGDVDSHFEAFLERGRKDLQKSLLVYQPVYARSSSPFDRSSTAISHSSTGLCLFVDRPFIICCPPLTVKSGSSKYRKKRGSKYVNKEYIGEISGDESKDGGYESDSKKGDEQGESSNETINKTKKGRKQSKIKGRKEQIDVDAPIHTNQLHDDQVAPTIRRLNRSQSVAVFTGDASQKSIFSVPYVVSEKDVHHSNSSMHQNFGNETSEFRALLNNKLQSAGEEERLTPLEEDSSVGEVDLEPRSYGALFNTSYGKSKIERNGRSSISVLEHRSVQTEDVAILSLVLLSSFAYPFLSLLLH
eukprot:Gb_18578 [translate_table: standard]